MLDLLTHLIREVLEIPFTFSIAMFQETRLSKGADYIVASTVFGR
jgi:hypothetical protein